MFLNEEFCFKLIYAKHSVATGSYIKLTCDSISRKLTYKIYGHDKQFIKKQCFLPPYIGHSICTLNGYDIVGSFVEYESGPAIHIVNVPLIGRLPTTSLITTATRSKYHCHCIKNYFFYRNF